MKSMASSGLVHVQHAHYPAPMPKPAYVFAAAYYTSFASVGVVIYVLRVKKGYRSLPEAINARYGPLASVAFGECSATSDCPALSI